MNMAFTSTLPRRLARALRLLALAFGVAQAGQAAHAADLTVAGNLVYNTDVVRIDFTVAAPGAVTLWTDSWQAGVNFDPELALFDASFALLVVGDDTADPAQLLPGQGGYDSQIRFASLAAGQYHLALTASGNDPLGPTFAAGFSLAGSTPIPIPLWNQPSYDINHDDQKGTAWRVHLDGVASVSAVPEPHSEALMAAGLAALFLLARRRQAN